MPLSKNTKLCFIGSSSRSGSTLLDRLLNQIEGFVSVGELVDLWKNGPEKNMLCSCGQPIMACHFWLSVFESAFGTVRISELIDYSKLHDKLVHYKHIPMHISSSYSKTYLSSLNDYQFVLAKLYHGIKDVSNANVIVDASKRPHFASVIMPIKDLEFNLIHMVRDSRAVAFSWQRKKQRPEIHWDTQFMPQHSLIRSSGEWLIFNSYYSLIRGNPELASYKLLKYEDFALNPEQNLHEILRGLGVTSNFKLIDVMQKKPRPYHSIGGNPSRFDQTYAVKLDNEWLDYLPQLDYFVTSLLTWPLLKSYHYSLSR